MHRLVERPDVSCRCPRCGHDDYRVDPTYDEDEAPTGVVGVFCARCDYHFEDTTVAEAVSRWHLAASTGR